MDVTLLDLGQNPVIDYGRPHFLGRWASASTCNLSSGPRPRLRLMEVAGRERFHALGRDRGSAVEELKLRNYCAGVEHRRIYRRWGYYQDMGIAARYRVKRIVVKPGSTLSLQKHFHRSEHWVVVKGTAEIIASRQDGQPGECRFLGNDLYFLDSHLRVCVLWDRNQSV